MSGIAEVLLAEGYRISGSDRQGNALTKRLILSGANIAFNHDAKNIEGADVVVISSAILDDNPEVQAAKDKNIPVLPRAQMLAELMRFRYGIAISGTHGKTTTTSLLACIFSQARQDPTFVIGGRLISTGSNAQLGSSDYLITEADESDASFVHLTPMVSIVTNIDREHMGTYKDDVAVLEATFLDFLHQLPFYGLAVLCGDDARLQVIAKQLPRPCLTYGLSGGVDVQAVDIEAQGLKTRFTVKHAGGSFPVLLNLPGNHNVQNALASIAVAHYEGIAEKDIQNALEQFQGIGRRFQVHGEAICLFNRIVTLVDDYGHHPKEIQVTLEALRDALPGRRIVQVFQPHRYSRTQSLFQDFAETLGQSDVLLLMPVYSAGESPIPGADASALCAEVVAMGGNAIYVESELALYEHLEHLLEPEDVLLLQGAGSIGKIAVELGKCAKIPEPA